MEELEKQIKQYDIATRLLMYEGDMAWKIMSAFMVVHALLVSVTGSLLAKEHIEPRTFNVACFAASVLGLVLIIPWYGTYQRNTDYYYFRMGQAKNCEPENWNLLNGTAEDFSEGDLVKISNKRYKMARMGKIMKNKNAAVWIVISFAIIYGLVLFFYGPWWPLQTTHGVNQ